MSYKQFIQELEDDILPSEAERRYLYNCNLFLVLKQLSCQCYRGNVFFPVADIKNTSQSISQPRNVSILTLTKRKNGDSHYLFLSFTLFWEFLLIYVTLPG